MKKYYKVFQLTLQEYFTYRLNFILWRFRSFISFVTLLVFWEAVYGDKTTLFGYEKTQIIAYVIGVAILRAVVLSSRSTDIAGQIKSGDLTTTILHPMKIFYYWLFRDFSDKLLNIFFSIFEVTFVLIIFRVSFYIPTKPETYLIFSLFVILAVFLYFFLSVAVSAAAFWTDDPWAMRFLIGIVFLEFMGGAMFPIDVLPKAVANIFYMTPFPYLIYFPIKIWNEQVSVSQSFNVLLITVGWLIIFYFLSIFLWKKGVKNYGAYGG